MANIWGQDMRPMGSAGMAGGYSALSPAINSGVYFPQTRSVQSSLIPPNTQAPSLAGTPSLLSGMTGSQYQTPPMAGQPQPTQPQMNQMSRFASYMQPQLAGQQRGTNQQASNPWWNQGRYNIGGYGGDMLQRRRPPQIGGGGVRRLDTGYGQPGGGFPWNTGGGYNQYQSPAMSGQNWNPGTANNALNNSLWQALQQRGFGTIPGGAPEGWTAYQLANGNIEYTQPGGGNWYRYNPSMGWYNSANPASGYSNVNPFANMNPGGSVATSAAY